MNKMTRNIVILVVVLAALGAGLWWVVGYEPATDGDEQSPASESTVIYKVDEASIYCFEIDNGDSELMFKTDGDVWTLAGYASSDISQSKVKSLIASFASISSQTKVEDSAEACGLDNPSITVKISLLGGTTDTIEVGAKSAVTGDYFCRVNGGDIYTLYAHKVDDLEKDAAYYTSFSRAEFNADEIFDIKIERKGKNNIHLSHKTEEGDLISVWEITEPYSQVYGALDDYISTNILDKIGNIKIDTPATGTNTGLSSPKAVVTLQSAPTDSDGNRGEVTTETFKIGNTSGDKTYIEYNGKAYEVSADSVSFADIDEFLLVSKLLALVPIKNLNGVRLVRGGESYDFAVTHSQIGSDDDKMSYSINGKHATEDKAKKVYQQIIGLSADGAYKGETLGDKYAEVVFESEGGKKTVEFYVIDDFRLSYTVNGKCEFTIKKSAVDKIFDTVGEFAENPEK